MKKARVLICLLGVLIAVSPLFAGGQGESAAASPKVTEINAVFDRILLEENGQKDWADEFAALTGVKINIVKPAHNQYPEILGATFATGDLPDICEIQTGDYVNYARSGTLVALNEFIDASQPAKDVPAELINAYKMKDGNIYGFPMYDGGGCVAYIRADWLENLDLGVPTTWDEFHNVLRQFTFSDPDGNGENDTIGMTLPFDVPAVEFDYYNRFIMQEAMFGFQHKNGRWVDGFTEPEMAAALTRFQQLYEEGVIDTEFFSNKTSTARSKIYEGQAGVMEYWSGTWAVRFDESAKNTNPRARVIPIAPIKNASYVNRVGPAFSITVAAKDPALVFDAVINTMLDKGKGEVLFTHGIEGMHYRKDGNGYVMMPEPANPDRPFDKAFSDPTLVMNGWAPLVAPDELITLSRQIHRDNSIQLLLPQGGDNYVKYVGELFTMKQEVFSKIVIGEYSVQKGIDLYRKNAANLHLADILAELNV